MATNNLISFELSAADAAALDAALTTIEGILNPKVIALTPEENQLYGKMGNETENYAKMVFDDTNTNPNLVPPHVDKVEWTKDVEARAAIAPRLSRINDLAAKLDQTNRLIGFDIFNAVSSTYTYTKYMAKENNPGFSAYFEKWKVQYAKNKSRTPKS